MKLFSCAHCKAVVFFESVSCTSCGAALAFLPELGRVSALDPDSHRACANAAVCNWAIPAADPDAFCVACRGNTTIPTDTEVWHRLELAKRRLFYTVMGLRLPTDTIKFAFGAGLSTGHADGLITIDSAEAAAPERERTRELLGETYRTLLGHFRHESGHYYFQRLALGTPSFRDLFGDDTSDYAAAQQRHYASGPPGDWRDRFVSAYASMHPLEDWAETWAHYLHMVDTLETARSYGLALRPSAPIAPVVARSLDFDDFDDLITAWVPLTLALNSLNRSMGLPDPYAFVLAAPAIAKLRFVHDAVAS